MSHVHAWVKRWVIVAIQWDRPTECIKYLYCHGCKEVTL